GGADAAALVVAAVAARADLVAAVGAGHGRAVGDRVAARAHPISRAPAGSALIGAAGAAAGAGGAGVAADVVAAVAASADLIAAGGAGQGRAVGDRGAARADAVGRGRACGGLIGP